MSRIRVRVLRDEFGLNMSDDEIRTCIEAQRRPPLLMAAGDDGDGTSLCKAKVDFDAPLPDRHALNLHHH